MKINPSHSGRFCFRYAQGFTLVEMLLVLTILAILAGIVYPRLSQHHITAQNSAAKVQIKAFEHALEIFEMENGRLPKAHDGLFELVQQPAGTPNWHGPYLDHIPKDPWGNDYVYVYPGRHRKSSFDLLSAGRDGETGNADDITSWETADAAPAAR